MHYYFSSNTSLRTTDVKAPPPGLDRFKVAPTFPCNQLTPNGRNFRYAHSSSPQIHVHKYNAIALKGSSWTACDHPQSYIGMLQTLPERHGPWWGIRLAEHVWLGHTGRQRHHQGGYSHRRMSRDTGLHRPMRWAGSRVQWLANHNTMLWVLGLLSCHALVWPICADQ